ncbi:MAG: AAA family ATPase [Gemmataceae bacterium]|nr:AAA family ATPase [Gemmataceae bacterium]MCI0737514.1 AAA family ATPase [Gemmataceae bacterium]
MSPIESPQVLWDQDVAASAGDAADWLWHGILARKNLTMLTSLWKSGKTTLIAHLLGSRGQAGELLGLAVKPGKTAVISEESRELWADRIRHWSVHGQVCFFLRPFAHIPTPAEWRALLEHVGRLHDEHGLDVVIIDPLAPLLPCENEGRTVHEFLLPLRALTERGLAALICHHPRKRAAAASEASRGHGSLLSHADVLLDMRYGDSSRHSRVRRLSCRSRYSATPARLVFELNADGAGYTVHPVDEDTEDFRGFWDALRKVLEDAPQKFTRLDILDEWPEDFDKPDAGTLYRMLCRAVEDNLVLKEGAGRKSDPFRYWLPESVARWKKENLLYDVLEHHRKTLNLPFTPYREQKRINEEADRDLRRMDEELAKEPAEAE